MPQRLPSWQNRILIFILVALPIAPACAQLSAKAAADDAAAAKMQSALTAAKAVYVWGDMQNCFDERLIFHAENSALTTALAAWGRYQITPTLGGSDVILEPTYSSGPEVCIIQVRDSHTLKVLGSFSEPRPFPGRGFDDRFDAMATSLMNDLKGLAGDDTAASPAGVNAPPQAPAAQPNTTPATSPEPTKLSEKELARQLAQQIQNKLTAAHKVLLVDDTLWSSGQSAIGKANEFALFQADLAAWGRYQMVSTVGSADLVIMVDDYMNCVRSIIVTGKLGAQCTPQIRLQVYEPTTLDLITQAIVEARITTPRPGKADPFAASVQAMTDQLRSAAGDAAGNKRK